MGIEIARGLVAAMPRASFTAISSGECLSHAGGHNQDPRFRIAKLAPDAMRRASGASTLTGILWGPPATWRPNKFRAVRLTAVPTCLPSARSCSKC